MKKTNVMITLVIAMVGIGLIGFQNFTRYKPRENSRDARDLYMGDALSTALKDAEKAEQKRKLDAETNIEGPTGEAMSDQAIEKPVKVERKTSSVSEKVNGSAQ